MERELQKINPNVTIPYWNWTLDSQQPERSVVFTEEYFGGNGKFEDPRCIASGPFVNMIVNYPKPHCLARSFNNKDKMTPFYPKEIMDALISSARNYDSFRTVIEAGPHGIVHNNIGGDMKEMWSNNDPIFWIHHSFVDKLWFQFQSAASKNSNDYSASGSSKASLDDELVSLGVKVSDVMDISKLCYSYQSQASPSVADSQPELSQPATMAQSPSFLQTAPALQVFSDEDSEIKKIREIAQSMFDECAETQPGSFIAVPAKPLCPNYEKISYPGTVSDHWLIHMKNDLQLYRHHQEKIHLMIDVLNSGSKISISSSKFVNSALRPGWEHRLSEIREFRDRKCPKTKTL